MSIDCHHQLMTRVVATVAGVIPPSKKAEFYENVVR